MNISFDGMNQWVATFAAAEAEEGQVVKMTDRATVGPCSDGEAFCGVVAVRRAEYACAVQLSGVVTVPYTDTVPAAGYTKLSADASGGVKSNESGREYLVLDADESAKTVTFVL